MARPPKWIALSYELPANPSKMRVYVWRKLRELGAESFKAGIAVLPNDREGQAGFAQLAGRIRQMGGRASLVELNFLDPQDDLRLETRFRQQAQQEYTRLLGEMSALLADMGQQGDERTKKAAASDMRRMIRQYNRKSLHRFWPAGAGQLERGLGELLESVRQLPGEFAGQLRALLEEQK